MPLTFWGYSHYSIIVFLHINDGGKESLNNLSKIICHDSISQLCFTGVLFLPQKKNQSAANASR